MSENPGMVWEFETVLGLLSQNLALPTRREILETPPSLLLAHCLRIID